MVDNAVTRDRRALIGDVLAYGRYAREYAASCDAFMPRRKDQQCGLAYIAVVQRPSTKFIGHTEELETAEWWRIGRWQENRIW